MNLDRKKRGGVSMKKNFSICMIVFVFWLLLTVPVYAYLDPGSGSMLLQLLLGGLAGLAIVLKLYWQRFLALFGIEKKKEE